VPVALYLHGFASSPRGRKIEALREILGPEGWRVDAPDLNVPSFQKLDFESMVTRAEQTAAESRPAVILGSSLGALVALEVSRRHPGVPLVLIAPAVGFGPRWLEKLPPGDPITFPHHGEGVELPIHRRFFEQLAALDVDRKPPSGPVHIVMGSQDESVPIEGVRRIWHAWEATGLLSPESQYIEIPGGDHGLVEHVGVIADAVRDSV
jgi:pimeloyl-ACP methyl ester carboxylesterase